MAMIRRPAEECRAVDSQVWTPLEEETGWDSVTMGLSHDDGLGSSVFQFTRVGSAVHLHRRRLLARPSRTPFG